MICFVRRSTIDYDIRLRKYVEACVQTNTHFEAITWDRLKNSTPFNECEHQYKALSPYGGGLKSFFSLVGWVFFMYWHLIIHFRDYKIIHACNLEVFVFVIPFRLFGKRIVFDIYDSINPKIERRLIKCADVLILPNERRLEQEGLSINEVRDKLFVVENVPSFKYLVSRKERTVDFSKRITLSYVGTLENTIRGLESLVETVMKDSRLYLDIAGIGGGMEPFLKESENKCNRIKYYGQVKYEQGLSLMANSDFIVAIYRPSFAPYKYASPNKFHESLFLGVPIITSADTLVGNQVAEYNTGYLSVEGANEISSIFKNADTTDFFKEYLQKKDNCISLWNNSYKDYFTKRICDEYIHKVLQ